LLSNFFSFYPDGPILQILASVYEQQAGSVESCP